MICLNNNKKLSNICSVLKQIDLRRINHNKILHKYNKLNIKNFQKKVIGNSSNDLKKINIQLLAQDIIFQLKFKKSRE